MKKPVNWERWVGPPPSLTVCMGTEIPSFNSTLNKCCMFCGNLIHTVEFRLSISLSCLEEQKNDSGTSASHGGLVEHGGVGSRTRPLPISPQVEPVHFGMSWYRITAFLGPCRHSDSTL